jgi:hypothetical protein
VTIAKRTTDGRPTVGCGNAAAGAEGSVILPVPAGRDASTLELELNAPPGTVLGTPQWFLLDDAAVERGMQDALQP